MSRVTFSRHVDAQQFDEGVHRLVGIFHELGVGIDVLALDARGEHVAVPVVDGAALGKEGLAREAALVGALPVRFGVHDLVIREIPEAERHA